MYCNMLTLHCMIFLANWANKILITPIVLHTK